MRKKRKKGEGSRGEGREAEATSSEECQSVRDGVEDGDPLASAGMERLGVVRSCLLKGKISRADQQI